MNKQEIENKIKELQDYAYETKRLAVLCKVKGLEDQYKDIKWALSLLRRKKASMIWKESITK